MIKILLRFWWKRTSENAACVMVGFAQHMEPKHLREIADYLHGLASDREHYRS